MIVVHSDLFKNAVWFSLFCGALLAALSALTALLL